MTAALVLTCLLAAVPVVPDAVHTTLTTLARIRPDVRVGEWVTYRIEGHSGRGAFLRLAVVAEEPDAEGRPAYWLELEVGAHASMRAPLAQLRMLVTRSLGFRPQGISRMFIALAHAPPSELTALQLAQLFEPTAQATSGATARPDAQVTFRSGPKKKRMTFAGTLEATPVELLHRGRVLQRVWLSPAVPLLGAVQIDGPGAPVGDVPTSGPSLQLFEYGLDATSQMRLPDPKSAKLDVEAKGTP